MVDLHTHTSLSDGSSSPAELLREAQQLGLTALAITDHDTLAGFDAALPLSRHHPMELICGVELSTRYRRTDSPAPYVSVHLLGYFFSEIPGEEFRAWLRSTTSSRRVRNIQLMDRLQAAGINISWEDFPSLGPDLAARPHFARVLVEKGYVADYRAAFEQYLGDPALAGVEREVPSTQEAIQQIVRNRGLASLAHPARICSPQSALLRSMIKGFSRAGMAGIEAFHSDHTYEEVALLLRLATEFNLQVTGGSDYHGANKPQVKLGNGRNSNLSIPEAVLTELKRTIPRSAKGQRWENPPTLPDTPGRQTC